MAKLSEHIRGSLRLFAFVLVNGNLQVRGLPSIDYQTVLSDPSTIEQAFAIWSNVLELDADGSVVNEEIASQRAAQYIRQQKDCSYVVDPPFEQWEIELHL
jgi:hypothetical protein